MSTYSVDFLASNIYSKLPPITPKENGIIYSTDAFMESTYKDEFSPKERSLKVKSFKPNNEYQKNNEVFDSQSSYSDDFIKNKVVKQKSLKPIPKYSKPFEKISSSTNYNNEFTEKTVEKLKYSKPIDNYELSKTQDEGKMISHYMEDYVEMKGEKVNSYRPNYTYVESEQNNKWQSNYQSEFVQPQREELEQHKCMNGKVNKSTNFLFPDSNTGNEYYTSYNENFIKIKEMPEKVKNCKPTYDYNYPGELFSGTSVYTSDFNTFDIIKPVNEFKPLNTYRPPEEPITSISVYKEEFSPSKTSPRVKSIKPVNQINIKNDRIDFITDYSKEFNSNPHRLIRARAKEFRPPLNYH